MAAPDAAAGETNLNFFYEHATFDNLAVAGDFRKIRRLAECCPGPDCVCQGKVELHMWTRRPSDEPEHVAVKRVNRNFVYINEGREPNDGTSHFDHQCPRRHLEDMLTEIGTYGYLFQENDVPEYILRMHIAFEPGPEIWMVLEIADGGDLFTRCLELHASENRDDISRRVRRWMWQLLRAVSYIHGRGVGHRDISLENVLLNGDDVRLMDFGQAVSSHSSAGAELRYFGQAGKDYYRPCNTYVPRVSFPMVAPADCRGGQVVFYKPSPSIFFLDVILPPDVVPGQRCTVKPVGYHVRPADVFACAVCAFILFTKLPPWQLAHPRDQTFPWVCGNGIVKLLQAWVQAGSCRQLAPEELAFISRAMNMDPSQRPTSQALLTDEWFSPEGAEGP